MDPAALLAIVERCAPPGVPPARLAALIGQASGAEPLLITVGNGRQGPIRVLATTHAEAIELAAPGMAMRDPNLRIGLGQLSVAQLVEAGLPLADAFDPCRSVAAFGLIVRDLHSPGSLGVDAPAMTRGPAAPSVSAPKRAEPRGSRETDRPDRDTAARQTPDPTPLTPWNVYGSSVGASLMVYRSPSRAR